MKIKKAIPVKNIHLTNRGKRVPLFIIKNYFRKYQPLVSKLVAAKVNI